MNAATRVAVGLALGLWLTTATTVAHGEPLRPAQWLPSDLTWTTDPRGYQQAAMVGDPIKPGMYALRVKFPPGLRIEPHFHPDERIVTVLAGTVHFGYGEQFDESKLRAFPAGSGWTEPARQPHFAWAKDGEVVLEVVGNGPSGTTPVPPPR
jgi:quercetin dioxygenase-like cupin family protein